MYIQDKVTLCQGYKFDKFALSKDEFHTVVLNVFLFLTVHCVPGRTELSGQCVLCDVGTYKEDAGNAACTNCSSIRTTAGKGSLSQADCNIGESYKKNNNHALAIYV